MTRYGRRRWIDALLIGAGVACSALWMPLVGVPLLILGATMPLLQWREDRQGGARNVLHLVPREVADAHAHVMTLAPSTGEQEAADDIVLQVAAVLAGRPPRGGAQQRFVAARLDALTAMATEMRERQDAVTAARAEVDEISGISLPDETPRQPDSALVGVFVVALFPFFLAWDLLRGIGRSVVALADGVALRVRTAGQLVVRVGHAFGTRVLEAVKRWAEWRTRVVRAAHEARHRFLAARLRLRMRLRNARR